MTMMLPLWILALLSLVVGVYSTFTGHVPITAAAITQMNHVRFLSAYGSLSDRDDPAGNAANIRALMQFYADGAIRPLPVRVLVTMNTPFDAA